MNVNIFKNHFVLIILFIVAGCSSGKVTSRETVIENQKKIIEDEITANIDSEYLSNIESISLLEKANPHPNDYKETLKYTADVRLSESAFGLTDIEIQELIEEIPMRDYSAAWYDDNSKKKYEFEVNEYILYLEDNLYKINRRDLTKNGVIFEPEKEYLAEQRKKERNKRYDVIFRISDKRYRMTEATKSEINARYAELMLERKANMSGHSQMGPKNKDTLYGAPLDWHKDVEILREYD